MQIPKIKFEWQDYALIVLIIIVLAVEFPIYNSFKQLPSPIFGGDIYYHYGVINHIYDGNSPFENSQFIGEYAHYPWFFHWLVAMTARLSGSDLLKTTSLFPLVMTALAGLVGYFIGKKTFDKNFALITSLLLMTFQIPNSVASNFVMMVSFPLFSYFLFFAENTAQGVLAGIFYGLVGLGHVGVFVGSTIMVIILFLGRLLAKHLSLSNGKLRIVSISGFKNNIVGSIKLSAPILIIGIAIAMLFWAPLIFVYKGETPNRWSAYVAAGEEIGFGDVLNFFDLIDTSRWEKTVITSLTVLGLIVILIKRISRYSLPLLIFVSMFIGYTHPIVTLPLLGASLGAYGFGYMSLLSTVLLALTAVFFIYKSVKNDYVKYAVIGLFAFLLVLNVYTTLKAYKEDQWVKVGREFSPSTKAMFEMADFIKTDTGSREVFLSSHEETGFAMNALTGRKVAIARRTHTSPFVGMNERVADSAVMLYGSDQRKVKELMKKYRVRYLYEDFYSEQSKIDCLKAWEILEQNGETSYNCLRVSPEYEAYLKENGLEFKKTIARLDVASPVAPKFEVLAIKPKMYNEYIQQNTNVLKEAKVGDQPVIRLLKINIGGI